MTAAHPLATCCWLWEVGPLLRLGDVCCLLLWKRKVLVRSELSDPVMGEKHKNEAAESWDFPYLVLLGAVA